MPSISGDNRLPPSAPQNPTPSTPSVVSDGQMGSRIVTQLLGAVGQFYRVAMAFIFSSKRRELEEREFEEEEVSRGGFPVLRRKKQKKQDRDEG